MLGRGVILQRFVRSNSVVLLLERVKGLLLLAQIGCGGEAVSCFRVWCILSCRPFCSGQPGWILSCRMPSRIHQIDSRLKPPGAGVANGGPLSVRMACGKPYSRKAASKTARARSSSVRSTC